MRFRKNAETYLESPMGDELALLDLESGALHGLAAVGLDVWRLLDSESDVARIAATLVQRYEVAPAVCEAEVTAFAEDMERAGFLSRC